MSNSALFLVRMDVAHDHEATFNEVYDREHAPNLRAVPGVRRAARYKQPSPTEPRYLAVRKALAERGVNESIIARASLPASAATLDKAGDQRVEIILEAK